MNSFSCSARGVTRTQEMYPPKTSCACLNERAELPSTSGCCVIGRALVNAAEVEERILST